MHMSLDRRVPLLLDRARYQKVTIEARARGVSVAEVIRQAIDAMPSTADRRRRAVDALLEASPMPVPADPADLRRELDAARERTP
jgi:hypothetical protein